MILGSMLSGEHDLKVPFGIFEGKYRAKDGECIKKVIILSFAEKKTHTIGRSSEADICDTVDTHISKINSVISCEGGEVSVKDCSSLNGTMVKLSREIEINKGHPSETIIFKNMMISVESAF